MGLIRAFVLWGWLTVKKIRKALLHLDKRLPDLTYKGISILWHINCITGGVTNEFPCWAAWRGHVRARSHTAQRNALSEFECCPSEMGHEMRAAFLCLQEKCHHIFSIPPQTVDSGVTQSSAAHTPFIDSYPLSLHRGAQHVVRMSTMELRSRLNMCHAYVTVCGGR